MSKTAKFGHKTQGILGVKDPSGRLGSITSNKLFIHVGSKINVILSSSMSLRAMNLDC
jgi:hypothetical protein